MQWDFLLCALFDSPEKTWITIQMDFDYNKEKTSLDIQKIHDIHQRKEEYEGRRTRVLQEEVIDEEEKLSPKKDEEKDEPILQKSHRENPIEKGKKSSTIQDTNEDSKNTKQEALSSTKIEEKQENGENKRK